VECRFGSKTRQTSSLPGILVIGGELRFTPAMKKHNHSSRDHAIQYDGKYSWHRLGQAKAKEHAT
jgi:hypothetical protein